MQDKIINHINFIKDNKKIALIHVPNDNERKAIHEIIENYKKINHYELRLNKYSIYHPSFPSIEDSVIKCECDTPIVLTYHDGLLPNNEDQYMTGKCRYCWHNIDLDCLDFYDNIYHRFRNNCIVMYFDRHDVSTDRRYHSSYYDYVPANIKNNLLYDIYFIDKPKDLCVKKNKIYKLFEKINT